MEDKPSNPGDQSGPPVAPVIPETDTAPEKYKGSRQAAKRSRARYHDRKSAPQGVAESRKSRSWPPLVLLGCCLAALVAVAIVALQEAGLKDKLFGPGGSAQKVLDSKPRVAEKKAQPQKTNQKAVEPADTGPAQKTEKAAQPAPATDPLKTLARLKEKLLSGQGTVEERKSFLMGCLGLLASAVDYYGQGLSDQGHRVLSELDRSLSPDFITRADLDGGLELSGVKTKIKDPGQGEKYLVISGFVRNGSNAERERVLLRAVLRDKDGKVIAKSFTLAGRTITEAEYSEPSHLRFRKLLDTSPDRGVLLSPTDSLPFLFVFTNPPASAKRFSVRIVLAPEKT